MKKAKVIGICAVSIIAVSAIFYSVTINHDAVNGAAASPASVTASITDTMPTVSIQAKYIGYDTADEIGQDAQIILIASPVDAFADRVHENTYYDDGAIQDFSTYTNLKIERVIKQPEGMNIGDQMKVIEPVSIFTGTDKKETRISFEGYREMKQGKRYVVFLKNNGMGGYSVINMNNGKFNLDGGDPLDTPTDRHEKEFKEKLKNDVIKKLNIK